MSGPMTWGRLNAPHPRLDLKRTKILNALYQGGACLLRDPVVMDELFPRMANEGTASYTARKQFAAYENVFAQAINHIVAGLAQDPVTLSARKEDGQEVGDLDPYWSELSQDATPPNDDRPAVTLDQVMRSLALQAIVTGFGWVLCDLPAPIDADSEAEQMAAGALKAYPVVYNTENVIDWEERNGRFEWVRSYSCSQPAATPEEPREWFRHEFVVWESGSFTRYVVELDKNGKRRDTNNPIKDDDVITPVSETYHSFGRVPWILFDASPDGEPSIHVGDLLESLARSLFIQQNAEVFIRMRAHAQQLYEFLAAENPGIDTEISESQKDPRRARKGERRSPDTVEVRGHLDKAQFIAPEMSGVESTQKAIEVLRESMLRITGQLALSQDTSGAMLRRSGESKQQDKVAEEIALGAIGKKLLACCRQVIEMLAAGRADNEDSLPDVTGYLRFSIDDLSTELDRVAVLENIDIPSATWKREKAKRIVRMYFGEDADSKVLENIEKELDQALTQESIMLARSALQGQDDEDQGQGGPGGSKPAPGKPGAPAKDEE